MIEYKVLLAASFDPDFRMVMASFGGEIKKAQPIVDKDEVLRSMRASHQQFLDELYAPKDPETEARIDKGHVKLLDVIMNDRMVLDKTIDQYSPQLSPQRFREFLKSLFSECLTVRPARITSDPGHIYWEEALRPSRIKEIVYSYGLDGQERTYQEVGIAMGRTSPGGISDHNLETRIRIARRLVKADLVLDRD